MDLKIFETLEEQRGVLFTGRINVLSSAAQHLGEVLLSDGKIVSCDFNTSQGLKAFYALCISEYTNKNHRYVVEPEVVPLADHNIHYPYGNLKKMTCNILQEYIHSSKNRPPKDIKILINPGFIDEGNTIDGAEFEVLTVLSDFNRVEDVYVNCELLEFEITNALVALRKKGALKVIKKSKKEFNRGEVIT